MPRLSLRALLLASIAALAACSSFGPNLVSPQLSLVGMQILSADMFAQQFKVRVKVENPNDLEVAGEGPRVRHCADGRQLRRGHERRQLRAAGASARPSSTCW